MVNLAQNPKVYKGKNKCFLIDIASSMLEERYCNGVKNNESRPSPKIDGS